MAKKAASERVETLAQELRRGVLVLAVLSQLREAQYGYSLKQRLEEQGLPIQEGTLYPLMRRLESQGLLTSEWEIADEARPRRYYRISTEGAQVLSELRQDWERLRDVVEGMLQPQGGGRRR